MTVKDKIFNLNADFQKSYYDTDLGFFTWIIPEKLNTIKQFMFSIIPEQHPLRHTINKHIELIDYELNNMKSISKNTSADFATKDNYINAAKSNTSKVLWRFHDDIYRFDNKILSQVLL